MMQIEKVHKRSSLMSKEKKDLVEHIIFLEHNNNALHQMLQNQAENIKEVCKMCKSGMENK